GRLEMDTNIVERAIRPLTITRKNSLFAGSDAGARRWAIASTLLQTCRYPDQLAGREVPMIRYLPTVGGSTFVLFRAHARIGIRITCAAGWLRWLCGLLRLPRDRPHAKLAALDEPRRDDVRVLRREVLLQVHLAQIVPALRRAVILVDLVNEWLVDRAMVQCQINQRIELRPVESGQHMVVHPLLAALAHIGLQQCPRLVRAADLLARAVAGQPLRWSRRPWLRLWIVSIAYLEGIGFLDRIGSRLRAGAGVLDRAIPDLVPVAVGADLFTVARHIRRGN